VRAVTEKLPVGATRVIREQVDYQPDSWHLRDGAIKLLSQYVRATRAKGPRAESSPLPLSLTASPETNPNRAA